MKNRIIVASLVLLMLAGCGVARNVSDTTMVSKNNYVERIMVDSVIVHDSVYIKEKADTVFYTKYHTLYKERLRVDTIMRCDTVYCDREVYVEKAAASRSWKPLIVLPLCAISLFLLWRAGVLGVVWSLILKLYKLCIKVFRSKE